ncbi:glycosyl hydrolase family 18 protein [Erwiniaceae bacterium BAC15a-03b]|uniref:Glycosyl hydrolase family 18 protein n=1 Tax=Winslowiella arboricola TaxID=2978220 RepID=A0A9J6PU31_9GAMM|nr:glycosyl hydrolase family 18 protein [Winslowiella arboricola]MCU5772710.1 glycosyl hydrolase family 18 protein [Winslowiella arboricola]MCU5778260.1 glycosyl hydrolase family 18 protein [Winslowiella arboricola]
MKKQLKINLITASLLLVGTLSSAMLSAATFDTADSFPDISNKKIMVGYWHNWASQSDGFQQGTAANIDLTEIPAEYNVITVAFMTGSGIPTFQPYNMSDAGFRQKVATLNGEGRPVLISLGGADAHIELAPDDGQKFASEIIHLADTYGFDGLDIHLAGSAIAAGANQTEIPAALKRVKAQYPKFIISLSPEFPDLRDKGGAWKKLIENLEGYYDFISPQFYNQNDDGVEGENGWYAQNDDSKKAEFLYTLTDSLVHGTHGYLSVPADKLVIGLPSNEDAAANGYVKNEADVRSAWERLAAQGTAVRGLMAWSVNWDAGYNKSGNAYGNAFIERFAQLINEDLPGAPDHEAPGQPAKPDLTVSEGRVMLSWLPASDNVGVSHYSIWRNGAEIAQSLLPEWIDTEVSAGNHYEYHIVVADKAGNLSMPGESSSILVEEEALAEGSEKPATPSELVASEVGSDRLTLSWHAAATDNMAVKHFRIYRNGEFISEAAETRYTDSGLVAGSIYEYQVAAVGAAEMFSDKSQPLIVKTATAITSASGNPQ